MEHALKLNASPAGLDTGFRRRASHAGSGEKYIKFVKCCPEAARRVLSTRLQSHLPLASKSSYKSTAGSVHAIGVDLDIPSPTLRDPPLFTTRPRLLREITSPQSRRFKRRYRRVWQNIDSSVERHDLCTRFLSRALAANKRAAKMRGIPRAAFAAFHRCIKMPALSHSHRDDDSP